MALTAVGGHATIVAGPTAAAADGPADQPAAISRAAPGVDVWKISPSPAGQAVADRLFDAAVPRREEDLSGKALVLVGGANFGRDFLLSEPLRLASSLGMRLILVEAEGKRPDAVPTEDFVPAPIFDHSPEGLAAAAETVVSAVVSRGVEVAGVATFFNTFVELAALVRDGLRARGMDLPGDGYDPVHAANEKDLARARLLERAPGVAVPYALIDGAGKDLEGAKGEAREAFARITGGDPSKRVVVKPVKGAGKVGIRVGVASAEEAAQAVAAIDADVRALMKGELGRLLSIDDYPGIMMELQLGGLKTPPEVDVEVALGPDGGFAFVIGNPKPHPPYQQEKGFSLPSPLPEAAQRALVEGALRALKAMGLRWGNFHVEMMLTEDGPRVVEFNTRMGGGNIFLLARRLWGASLIEQGLRGVLDLPVLVPGLQNYPSLVSRYFLPLFSGTVRSVSGVAQAEASPGVLEVAVKKKPGDRIVAPQDGFADDDFGHLVATGRDFREARSNAFAAMARLGFEVERADGEVLSSAGDYQQGGEELEEAP